MRTSGSSGEPASRQTNPLCATINTCVGPQIAGFHVQPIRWQIKQGDDQGDQNDAKPRQGYGQIGAHIWIPT